MESNEANIGEAEMLSRVSALMRDHLPERVSPSPSEDWYATLQSIKTSVVVIRRLAETEESSSTEAFFLTIHFWRPPGIVGKVRSELAARMLT